MKTLVLLTMLVVGVLSMSLRNDEAMEIRNNPLGESRGLSLLEALRQKGRQQGDAVIAQGGSGNEWGASGDRELMRNKLMAFKRNLMAAKARKAGAEVPGAVVPGEINQGSWGTQRKMNNDKSSKMTRVSMPEKK